MKQLNNLIISCVMAMVGTSTTVAQDAIMDWALYDRPTTAINSTCLPEFLDCSLMDEFNVEGVRNYAAVCLNKKAATEYAGCRLKGIKVVSGLYEVTSDRTIRLSIARSLNDEPIYSTEYSPIGSTVDYNTWEFTWERDVITFPDDVDIILEENQELYAILEYTEASPDDFEYIVYVNEGNGSSPKGSYYSALEGTVYINGEPRKFTKEWKDISQDITVGPLCLSFTLEGAGMEQNSGEIVYVCAHYSIMPY